LGCGSAHGCVDGAWWPKTPNLAVELPDIVAVFSRWIGTVHRVVYDPTLWKTPPSRLIRHGAAISVDPYRMVNRETIGLMGTHSRSAVLFVVPPSTSAAVANRMLRLVESATKPMPASFLLQRYAEFAAEAIASKTPDVAVGEFSGR
jgi:hypothetical protein